jgi:glutamate racemase
MADDTGAVGIFDSGVGGLTVLRRVAERLPNEPLVYLGDTARVPYGTKSAETVVRYARGCARTLLDRGVKLLVVACNTASAHALDVLRNEIDVPVVGVVEPGARRAAATTRNGRIGVIGTAGTVGSGSYQTALRALLPGAQVFAKACPLFVPLAEEGWTDGDVPREVARTYLDGLVKEGIDTLVLGCTHYPLLRDVIAEVVGDGVAIVESGEAVAEEVEETLERKHLRARFNGRPGRLFLATDAPENLARVGQRFLGEGLASVEWVDVAP